MPQIRDPDLVVERYASGIPGSPTTMAFLDDDTIIVLQKHDGQVRLVRDGTVSPVPLLDASVANAGEQGMLGVAVKGSDVYLYYTESAADGGDPLGKRVYKYRWDAGTRALVDPLLVRDFDETQTYHNGGAMATAPDGAVYLALGDAGRYGLLQNHGRELYEDTSVITRVDAWEPYYAIGVRNSFGLAFDPYTGVMWDAENGDDDFDEINMVKRNFNSGWYEVMGPATEDKLARLSGYGNYTYSDPKFSWEQPVAPTALSFVKSEPLARFGGSLFVGACNTGELYKFTMNERRDGFAFASPHLSDNVANWGEPADELVFGTGFGCITDIEVGPDGLLYILSLSKGAIFRMAPPGVAEEKALQEGPDFILYPVAATVAAAAGIGVYLMKRKRGLDSIKDT